MDVVIANPPFGKKKDNNKTALKFFVKEMDAKTAFSLKKEFSSKLKPSLTFSQAVVVFFWYQQPKNT